ncbi:hypothetical protein BD626DRAFT_543569 [Schizophyllum amplum]|uniref:Uncharacterized protein n=1 Tax=Schizophyllum amplum TaxID=97359 RepID=A0A550BRM7_9AGAR|nr:hypothetical protein BD626DRAFT_543569 [Auriculariopsis ampla]
MQADRDSLSAELRQVKHDLQSSNIRLTATNANLEEMIGELEDKNVELQYSNSKIDTQRTQLAALRNELATQALVILNKERELATLERALQLTESREARLLSEGALAQAKHATARAEEAAETERAARLKAEEAAAHERVARHDAEEALGQANTCASAADSDARAAAAEAQAAAAEAQAAAAEARAAAAEAQTAGSRATAANAVAQMVRQKSNILAVLDKRHSDTRVATDSARKRKRRKSSRSGLLFTMSDLSDSEPMPVGDDMSAGCFVVPFRSQQPLEFPPFARSLGPLTFNLFTMPTPNPALSRLSPEYMEPIESLNSGSAMMHPVATVDMGGPPIQQPSDTPVSPVRESDDSIGSLFVSVYDIFLEVCKALLATEVGRADLLRLATVNRAVSDVALDVLWEKQNTITNLFRVLPRIEEIRVLLTLRDPKRNLTDDEYARFMSYASRIKVLEDSDHIPRVPTRIDQTLLLCILRRGPVLPNVRTLRGEAGGTFEKVDMQVQWSSNDTDAVLAVVRSVGFTVIQTLGVFAPLSHICSLTISPGENYEAIPHLRHLASLEELHLYYFRSPGLVPNKPPAPAPGFRALRTLLLSETRGIDHAYEVLRAMSSEPMQLRLLEHYDFRSYSGDDGSWRTGQHDARRFYRLLRDRVDRSTLTTLRITQAALFSALRAFPNITRTTVFFNHEQADINGALDVLTAMWPRLSYLCFRNRTAATTGFGEEPDMSRVTLAGLVPIATRCPELSILNVPLDLQEVPEPVQLLEHEVLEGRLVHLNVQDVTPYHADVEGIVQFLASIFPAMTLGCIYACDLDERTSSSSTRVTESADNSTNMEGPMQCCRLRLVSREMAVFLHNFAS